jgi:hypothetical protein
MLANRVPENNTYLSLDQKQLQRYITSKGQRLSELSIKGASGDPAVDRVF